ncbi:MAG: copper chaperone PCu(A)C [Proteobacteria bacterium]|nr:copper chaperone PCu(A)C [Pseudomonadota bacterium]
MKKNIINVILGLFALSLIGACAPQHKAVMNTHSEEHKNMVGSGMMVGEPWARATAKGQQTSAVYTHLHNLTDQTEYLLAAASDVANTVEIHNVIMEDGMMAMRPVKHIEIAPDQMVELKPGSYHIMLIGLKNKLIEGSHIDVTLTFKNAGKRTISAPVRKMMKMPMQHNMESHKKHMKKAGVMKKKM